MRRTFANLPGLMSHPFFDHPILNSPYARPGRHWELDDSGQPTQLIVESRRRAQFITPIPKPKKRKKTADQQDLVFDEGAGLSTSVQQYDPTSIINEVRGHVDTWRALPAPAQWQVTPETARLLQHWRHYGFSGVRPFFCQVEAVETAIWLSEVAPQSKHGKRLLDHLVSANRDANPELMRLALKLATGAGKTTVMAMLIAWQTINAVRRPVSKLFTRGFLICAPGLTIKDRLRVLQANDPDSYYKDRELVPGDMLDDMSRAKIVITNYHAFKLRERVELSKGGRQLLQGRTGDAPQTLETEGQMLQRVMPDLMGMSTSSSSTTRRTTATAKNRRPPMTKTSKATTGKKPKATTKPRGCGSPVSKPSTASSASPASSTCRRRPFSCAVPATPKARCSRGR
jgi:type III restriction enzyme